MVTKHLTVTKIVTIILCVAITQTITIFISKEKKMQDYQFTKLRDLLKDLQNIVTDEKKQEHLKNCEKYRFVCDKRFRNYSDSYQESPTSQVRWAISDCEAIVNFFDKVKSFSYFPCSVPENEKAQLDLLIRLKKMEKDEIRALADTITLINNDDLMRALNQKVNEIIAEYHKKEIYPIPEPTEVDIHNFLAETQPTEFEKQGKGKYKEKFWTNLSNKTFFEIADLFPIGHKTIYAVIGAAVFALIYIGVIFSKILPEIEGMNWFTMIPAVQLFLGVPIGIPTGLIIEKKQLKKAEEMQREWKRLFAETKTQKLKEYNEKLSPARSEYYAENGISGVAPDLSVCEQLIPKIAEILINVIEEKQRILSGLSGWENYDVETLKGVKNFLDCGRADTIKEGLNLYLAEKQREQDLQTMRNALAEMEAQVEAEKKKNLAILGAVAVALKNQNEANQKIAESQQKQKELFEEANRHFEETKRKQQEIINELEDEERQRKELLKRL